MRMCCLLLNSGIVTEKSEDNSLQIAKIKYLYEILNADETFIKCVMR